MFESIDELINEDVATSRRRYAIGGVSSLMIHVLVVVIAYIAIFLQIFIATLLFKDDPSRRAYTKSGSNEDLVEIARVVRLPLPPTPRTTPATNSRPTGNAMVEREVISSRARTDADKKGEVSKQLGPEPPNISNVPSAAPPPSSGPTVSSAVPVVTEAPPPPIEKEESSPQIDAEKLKGMVRRMASTQPGTANSGGGGQKGMSINGGAGVDIGENKVWIERRIQNIWRRTKSDYSEMQRSGRTVVVYFDWYRDGRLVFASFGTTTGNPALDNEARNAVQNASPYIPIPKEITLDVIHLNATFTY